MGRHADAPGADDAATTTGLSVRARVILAGTAAVATVLAMSWSGAPWWVALTAGGGVAVVVVLAAWVAGTLPGPPPGSSDPVQ